MDKSYGKVAYDAFLPPEHQSDGKLSWENLDPVLKEHWEAAATAVINEWNRCY